MYAQALAAVEACGKNDNNACVLQLGTRRAWQGAYRGDEMGVKCTVAPLEAAKPL